MRRILLVSGVILVIAGTACLGYAQVLAAVTVVPSFEAGRHAQVALFRRWGLFAITPGVAILLLELWRSRHDV
jgi:hypothetical protein